MWSRYAVGRSDGAQGIIPTPEVPNGNSHPLLCLYLEGPNGHHQATCVSQS
jgi:hypothetical protein